MKTATEKYNAVLEGTMAKREFVRQMKQQFPQFISQFNGFDDSVQILKNKGMIFEAKKEKDNGYKVPEVNIPLDVIERGVDAELEAAGIDSAGVVTKEQYLEAKRKALHNLKKDMNHYLNLMAGESSKVDKNDKMKETKRGAQDKDTYNDMKKATLKEVNLKSSKLSSAEYQKAKKLKAFKDTDWEWNAEEGLYDRIKDKDSYNDIKKATFKESTPGEHPDGSPKSNAEMGDDEREDFYNNLDSIDEAKQNIKSVASAIKAQYGDIPGFDSILKDYLQTHMQDIKSGMVDNPIDDFNNFVDINYDRLDEKKAKPDYIDLDKDGNRKESMKKAAKDTKLKEAIKTIITKVLTEGTLNEAATANLADFADEYSDFEGMKQNIIALQDIVTDIESFYDKTRQKIQKIYTGLGDIRNDEGIKVGAFLAPAIETAFNKDLSPVTKQGFTKGLETPKVRTISQEEIDAARAGGELEEEPKQTVFTPIQESKKRK